MWPSAFGETLFPREWTADRIEGVNEDVATIPESSVAVERGGRTLVTGTRDGVVVMVVVDAGGEVATGFLIGPARNPSRSRSGPWARTPTAERIAFD